MDTPRSAGDRALKGDRKNESTFLERNPDMSLSILLDDSQTGEWDHVLRHPLHLRMADAEEWAGRPEQSA
jgi:hypothetical protein